MSSNFSAKDLVELVKACRDSGVSELTVDPTNVQAMTIKFFPKVQEEAPVLELESEATEKKPGESKYNFNDDLVLTDPDALAMGHMNGVAQ